MITDHESAAMRRMHKLVQQSADSGTAAELDLPKQKLEINPKHPIITGLDQARRSNPPLAITIAEQVRGLSQCCWPRWLPVYPCCYACIFVATRSLTTR